MKLYHWIILLFSIAVSVFLGFQGIRWGIPSEEKADLVLSQELHNEHFYQLMKHSREEIYNFSGGSPIGRLKNFHSSLPPVLRSIGIKENENLFFDGDEKILSNFIRPYLLRSNHTDEQMTISALAGMHPRSFDFNPRMFPYGGVYIYSMGAFLGISHVLGYIRIRSDLNYYLKQPQEMGKIFTAGRFYNIFFLVPCLVFLFLSANLNNSFRAGLFALIFFAFSPALIFQVHIMKPYIMATFFGIMCIYFSQRLLTGGSLEIILAGVSAGLSAGAMPVYGFIIIIPLIAILNERKALKRNMAYVIAAAGLTFIITNPYWIINISSVIREYAGTKTMYFSGHSLKSAAVIFTKQLLINIPSSFLIFTLFSLVYLLKFGKRDDRVLSAGIVISSLLFAFILREQQVSPHISRFLLLHIAMCSILCGRMAAILFDNNSTKTAALLIFSIIMFHTSSMASMTVNNFILDGTENSTRIKAGRWIMKNIPPGAEIALEEMPEPAHVPPFAFSKYKITVMRGMPLKKMPEYVILINKNLSDTDLENFISNYRPVVVFRPVNSALGINYGIWNSHINSEIKIFKRLI